MAETHDGKLGAAALEVDETEQSMGVGEYIATRFSSLKPPMHRAPNPFKALTLLNRQQWLFFLVSEPIRI
jgi:MFS transporter, SHS family, lactate transporter